MMQLIKKLIPKKIFKAAQPCYHFILSWLSVVYYRFPSRRMIVIGVTGTSGKTTSVYMIAKSLQAAGYKVGMTSTSFFSDGEKEWFNDKKMTMPGRFFIQKILRRMVDNCCRIAVVETTSEGIVQFRHRFINYDMAVFTGLYPEHIESHGSFENYKRAKGRLFKHLGRCRPKNIAGKRIGKTIIANADDGHADYFLSFKADKKIVYSSRLDHSGHSLIKFGSIREEGGRTIFNVGNHEVRLQIPGKYNAYNAMNALAVGFALGVDRDRIRRGLEGISGVAGRLERIDEGQDFLVIVDYAYEPEALKGVFNALGGIGHQRIIHVFGSAGGGRDKARRPLMAGLSEKYSDIIILTNEDPYDEDELKIIKEIEAGLKDRKLNSDYFIIQDREKAIQKAISLARAGDLVLITGKGNEQAIVTKNNKKIPWDDRKITRKILNKK